ncbi:MAG: primosomal protein N' [Rhodothalassiaceae bacterium]
MAEKAARLPVLLPIPQSRCYSYLADGDVPEPGRIVRVPFGPRSVWGVVWDGPPDDVPEAKLKRIAALSDLPSLDAAHRRFLERTASWTMSPRGAVLRMALPQAVFARPAAHATMIVPSGTEPDRMTPARRKVLNALADGTATTAAALARKAGTSPSVVTGLLREGVLLTRPAGRTVRFPAPDITARGPDLTADQQEAAMAIAADIAAGGFRPSLLDGVTGSGKTEVYFEAIAEALRHPGAQCLVLLPEIALTGQWLARFAERFGAPPAEWHSGLSPAARRRVWMGAASGTARVVVGARSALFLPFRDLRLIVVDEEHDPSFKQEDGVLYQARDMAVLRASIGKFPILLASATPSLESLVNARRGRYRHLRLTDRHGGALLPKIEAVDLRRTPPARGDWIAPPLARAISENLERGEQCLLFLNRRGYAPLTLCRTCGTRLACPNCTAWLVEHRIKGQLLCHHCGHAMAVPAHCPTCRDSGSLVPCGPGVERINEEVLRRWPTARTATAASDSIASPAAMRSLIARMEGGAIDILIGTQMVTKGHHFPRLTLVGVIDADIGLRGGDLRAGERACQQLIQVSGRAGRGERPGRALIQTYDPEHPATAALIAGDLDRFIEAEIAERSRAFMPPFGRLAGIVLTGAREEAVIATGRHLAAHVPRHDDISVYGPAPAPLARLRGRYRHRLLVHGRTHAPLQPFLRVWLERITLPRSVTLRIDIDPASFL